jgi:RNA polymerase sigma-70 factor (ECF subfamily)
MTDDTRSDAELMKRARRDPDAFRVVYDRHCEAVHRFMLRRTGNADAALELTAETFAQAWLSRSRFRDMAGGSAGPWLFGIGRKVLAQSARRRRVERDGIAKLGLWDAVPVAEEPADDAWLDGMREDLGEALDELSARDREALELRVIQERSFAEVAAAIDSTPGAARVRVFRVLAHLRGRLATTTDWSDR